MIGAVLTGKRKTWLVSRGYWKTETNPLTGSQVSGGKYSSCFPKVVQERLGYSSISITLDIYSHLIPSMQRDAIKDFEIPTAKQKVG